jgi:hypothetical protein
MTDHSNPFLNLDKLLATPTPPEKPVAPPLEKQGNKVVSQETSNQVTPKPVQIPKPRQAATPVPFTPDLLQPRPLTRKQTFELTKAELDFMAQAKFELRHISITKNEMVLTGLELLAKDYAANQKNSYLYRKFMSREAEGSEE